MDGEKLFMHVTEGKNGRDGVSPEVTVERVEGGLVVTIKDVNGTTYAELVDGRQGEKGDPGADGKDGVSPTARVERGEDGTVVIVVKDASGETREEISKGVDGVSPTVTVEQTETGATVTITDANGTTTAELANGAKGDRGERGEQGITGEKGDKGDPYELTDADKAVITGSVLAGLENADQMPF